MQARPRHRCKRKATAGINVAHPARRYGTDIDIRAAASPELGEWFHNIDLRGIRPRPTTFLGDYPAIKWRRFADAIPADLHGRTVLDIGCNGGFYSHRDEAPRRRPRGRHRLGRALSRAGALRRRGLRRRDRIPTAVGLPTSRELARAVRHRALHGRALSPAPSAACARSAARARHRRSARVPVACCAASTERRRRRRRLSVLAKTASSTSPASADALRRARYSQRPDELVDSQPRVRRGDAAQRRLRDRRPSRSRGLLCRRTRPNATASRDRGGAP